MGRTTKYVCGPRGAQENKFPRNPIGHNLRKSFLMRRVSRDGCPITEPGEQWVPCPRKAAGSRGKMSHQGFQKHLRHAYP